MNLPIDSTPLWLDCDPGIDDTMAIILASHTPSLNLVGLSACQGNSTIEHVRSNCLKILNAIDRLDVPVVAGVEHPICHQRPDKVEECIEFHGPTGMMVDWPVPEALY